MGTATEAIKGFNSGQMQQPQQSQPQAGPSSQNQNVGQQQSQSVISDRRMSAPISVPASDRTMKSRTRRDRSRDVRISPRTAPSYRHDRKSFVVAVHKSERKLI